MKKILLVLVGLMFWGSTIKAQWNQYLTGQESLIRDISVVNDNVVWIKDQKGIQFSITTDGGTSWTTKNFPADMTKAVVGGFSAVNATTAYAVISTGSNLGIYKTTNSGDTWEKQTSGFSSANSFPDFVHFWNENDGVAVGDGSSSLSFEIYTTNNGGTQWTPVNSSSMPSGDFGGTYNSNSIFQVHGNSIYFGTGKGQIFKSSDKGLNWSLIKTALTSGDNMSFDFKDADNGVLYSYISTTNRPVLYSTIDGGQNWTSVSPSNIYGNIKYIPSQNVYFSTGSTTGLSYSADNGQTWTVHPAFQYAGLSGVDFTPSGKILMGGFKYMYNSINYTGVNPSVNKMKITDTNKIDITFSKEVESVSSQNITNYIVSYKQKPDNSTTQTTYPIKVISASLDNTNKCLVHLVTETSFPIDTINANVINVKDLDGFPIINRSSSAFASDINNPITVTAGSLSTMLTAADLATISNLKLVGAIDARDFVTMRDQMPKLATLDLSGVSIAAYSGTDGPSLSKAFGAPAKVNAFKTELGDIANEQGTINPKMAVKTAVIAYPANEIPEAAFFNYATSTGKITLKSIVLPATLTSIGNNAFTQTGLASINFPETVTKIGDWAFLGTSLSVVNIPASVNVLGFCCFSETQNNTSYNVSTQNLTYTSVDGVLFSKDQTTLIAFPSHKTANDYSIPPTVKTIQDYAFEQSSIYNITFPASLQSIGSSTFMSARVSSVDLSSCALLTSVGDHAFSSCSNLSSISLPKSVQTLGFGFVIFSTGLTGVSVDANNSYFSSVDGVLYNKDKTALLIYPQAKSKSGEYILPTAVTQIGDAAFAGTNFTSINAANSLLTKIGRSAFNQSQLVSAILPSTVNEIVKLAFASCSNLQLFKIANATPSTLGDNVFYGVNKATCTLNIPTNATNVYKAADQWKDFKNIFEGEIAATRTISLTTPGTLSSVLSLTGLNFTTELTINGDIDARDFKVMRDSMPILTKIDLSGANIKEYSGTLGTDVTIMDYYNTSVYAANTIPQYAFLKKVISGSGSGSGLHVVWESVSKKNLREIILPATITTISNNAFSGTELLSITIPKSVTSIAEDAFSNCVAFENLNFEIPSKLTSIGNGAFYKTKLSLVSIPATVATIGNNSFEECKSLKTIVFPDALTSIGNNAFSNCTKLESVSFPPSLLSIGEKAFYGCNQLGGTLTIPSSVTNLGQKAFMGCCALSSVNIGSKITKIQTGTFEQCTGLKSVIIPASVNSIGLKSFAYCTELSSVTLAEGLTSIEESAFTVCPKLTSIIFPTTITSIGAGAFANSEEFSETIGDICVPDFHFPTTYSELKSIKIPASITTIGLGAFWGCVDSIFVDPTNPNYSSVDGVLFDKDKKTLLQCPISKKGSYILPESTTKISMFSFVDCDKLSLLSIPKAITSIGSMSFALCSALKDIYVYNPIPIKLNIEEPEDPETYVFNGFNNRLCTLHVPAGSKSAYLADKQAANEWKDFGTIVEFDSFSVSSDKVVVPALASNNRDVIVNSLSSWTVSSNQSWLKLDLESGSGNATLIFTAATNATTSSRNAVVTVTEADGSSKTITITQAAASVLYVSINTVSVFANEGSTASITLSSNTSWTASSDQSWLTASPVSGNGNTTLAFTAAANTATATRTAIVTITETGGASKTVTVTQAGISVLSVSAATASVFANQGSTASITLSSNTSWTASSDQSWLAVSPVSGNGNTTLAFTAAANTATATRTAIVTITETEGASKTVTVTQAGISVLSVSAATASVFANQGSTASITLSSNTSWTASSDQSWLAVSPVSGNGNTTLAFTAAVNTATATRTAIVTITETGGASKTVTVTQSGISVLSVSSTSASVFANQGSAASITLSSNTSWTASSDQSWLAVSPTSGNGNAILTITAAANTATSTRTAIVTITETGGASKTVTVTQVGISVLSVSATTASVFANQGSAASITLSSNTSWTASSDQPWLTVSPGSGNGNATLTITAAANTTTSDRTATVTITENGGATKTIAVEQAKQSLLIASISKQWDDVLVCNNSEKLFSSYQWYKNDIVLTNETKQYYQEIGGLNGSYYLKVTTTDGRSGTSNTINVSSTAKSIKVYPNPVVDNQSFRLEIKATEMDLKQAQLTVLSLNGQLVSQDSSLQPKMQLKGLPKGCYIIHIRLTNGEWLDQKLTVN